MTRSLQITGGCVYDPVNGLDGVVRRVSAVDGRVVESLAPDLPSDQVLSIDATGCIVMPGAVEIHTHIVKPSLHGSDENILPSQTRADQPLFFTPSQAAQAYTGLGYTTVIEASIRPSEVQAVKFASVEMSNLDLGFLLELGNNEKVFEMLSEGRHEAATDYAAGLVRESGAYGIKLVNPGALIHAHRGGHHDELASLDQPIAGTGVTTRAILEWAGALWRHMDLPTPPHVHAGRLGTPGNIDPTLQTLRVLQDSGIHLVHAQFYGYGSTPEGGYRCEADRLSQFLSQHPRITADVGQIVFGPAWGLTGDTLLEARLHRVFGRRPRTHQTQQRGDGEGVVPMMYSPTNPVHSLMWATGLELVLSCKNLWQLSLSVDHPNGGPFTAYPQIIAWLMDKAVRDEQLDQAHPYARKHSLLGRLDRQLTLNEIAILTRAAPARALGLEHKGHLGPGADADIVIYSNDHASIQSMFTSPRTVIKNGVPVLVEAVRQTPIASRWLSPLRGR